MRENLNIFVVPESNRPLDLQIKSKNKDHVVSGKLFNKNNSYPITRGIPRFIDKSFYKKESTASKENQTSKSFGKKWREDRNKRLGDTIQDRKDLSEQFMAMLGCTSTSELKTLLKKAKSTLNAGCGVAWSEYLFNFNKNTIRHCIDLSLSIETAYERTKALKNVIVSQASVFELPYANNTFDIVYSNGVLHHTPDPKNAFKCLAKKVRPGGILGIYIYNKKPFLRELADERIRQFTSQMSYAQCMKFSKQMSQLGKSLNNIKVPISIKEDIKLLGIKKGTYNIHDLIYRHFLKCWYNQKQDISYADLVNQDWYNPYYASHHTKEEIFSWFQKSGISRIKCFQPKGWEHSGYFISGRKK